MSSVKYKLDVLMVLRAVQVVLTTEMLNLGFRIEAEGIVDGSIIPNLFALMEFVLLIIVWTLRSEWKIVVNLYTVFMTCTEVFWIISLLTTFPYVIGITTIVLLLIFIRVVALVRLNYIETKKTV